MPLGPGTFVAGIASRITYTLNSVATFATIMSPQRFQSLATRPGLDAP